MIPAIRPFGLFSSRRRDDLSFLPAALEIVETPASPTVRVTAIVVCLVFATAIAWAALGKIDIVATAPGKVIAVERTRQIQAPDAGIVARILVADGDRVVAGQTLMTFDPRLARADRDRFEDLFRRTRLDLRRLEFLLDHAEPGGTPSDEDLRRVFADVDASPEQRADAVGQAAAMLATRDAKIASADQEIAAKRAEKVGLEADVARIDATLPIVRERASIRKNSLDRAVGSRIDYLNALQAEVDLASQRDIAQERAKAAGAAIQTLLAERKRILAESVRDWRTELQRATREHAEARAELAKAMRRMDLTNVAAPIDGVVEELAVRTEGSVVQSGQQLLKIVPVSGAVAIEAIVENRDAGFVRVGQEAEVKIDSFPFTRYGLLAGRVVHVASDAEQDPESVQQVRAGTQPLGDSAEAVRRSGGLVYVTRIALDDPTLLVDGRPRRIIPGMSAQVEIKTGRRTLLEFVLSPVARTIRESLHER